jgi:Zn-dependent protease
MIDNLLLQQRGYGLLLATAFPAAQRRQQNHMKIFGIPVKVEASFLMVLLMATARSSDLSMIAEWGLVVFFSILIHEMGHAFAGRAFGLEPQITLYAMGGVTSWIDNRKEISPSQSIRISLAGPVSGLVLGGLVFLLQPFYKGDSLLVYIVISDLLWINIAWSLFNLLPIVPLDGGHVLESVEEWWRGSRENICSIIISLTVATAVFVWAFTIKSPWIAFLTAWFAWSNASAIIRRIQRRVDQPLEEKLAIARKEMKNENGQALIKLSEEIFAKAKAESVRRQALELLIYGHIYEQDFTEAQKCLHQYRALFGANLYTEGFLLYRKGELEQAAKLLEEAFNKDNSWRTGEMFLHVLLKTNQLERALQLCSQPTLKENAAYCYLCVQAQAFETRQMALAIQIGLQAFEKTSDPIIAYNIGCAFAQQNNLQEAFNWILCAVQNGFNDRALIESDADIAEVRKLPEFERVYRLLAETEEVSV